MERHAPRRSGVLRMRVPASVLACTGVTGGLLRSPAPAPGAAIRLMSRGLHGCLLLQKSERAVAMPRNVATSGNALRGRPRPSPEVGEAGEAGEASCCRSFGAGTSFSC